MKKEVLKEKYLNNLSSLNLLVEKEEKLLFVLSASRLVTFIGGLILIWFGFIASLLAGLLLTFGVISFFLYLLLLYSFHSGMKEFLGNLALINRNEADAIAGDLSAFEPGNKYIDQGHDFSNDVDLFGNSSLFQYINRTVTGYGRDILASWLSDPYKLSHDLIERQEAVKELSVKEKWRQEFLASGMKLPLEKDDITGLLEWMGEESTIKSSSIQKIFIFLLPFASIISLALLIAGILHYSVFVLIFLINLLFITAGLKNTNRIHRSLSRKHNQLSSLNVLLRIFENESFTSGILIDIQTGISGKEISAAESVKKLNNLIQAFDTRLNILVGILLNGLILWDYQSIYRLEKWKSVYREHFPVWLEMLGKVDAFISLGNYASNNEGFAYPVISESKDVLSTKNLGHQLIEESKRVCNDFSLGKSGTICIISGANMSGKSTFLRTIAVNYILAMTGAPVCAGEMKFVPLKLFTSMRTTDSLSHNESYFYAELKRLKSLKSAIENGEPVLFILDEILKGTNSADKSLGSKLFLTRLFELGGTGLIATHDTSLGDLEKTYPDIVVNKCFEIEIEGEIIRFDYKLHNGITQKMNAALLMKQMGILD